MSEQTVRGYRILGESKPDKQLSYDYLKLSAEGSHALQDLWREAVSNGANCLGREDEFTGDDLPSDRDAQLMCAGCPAFEACEVYRRLAHPAWGVYSGQVHGRKLAEAMKEDSDA